MIRLDFRMAIGIMDFFPTDLEFLQRMPLIWIFYMNSPVGFQKKIPQFDGYSQY
jgi:hypothetical protein